VVEVEYKLHVSPLIQTLLDTPIYTFKINYQNILIGGKIVGNLTMRQDPQSFSPLQQV
jgi:hypothetical protein